MGFFESLNNNIKKSWMYRGIIRRRHDNLFESPNGLGLHRGVFKTFAEANASIPQTIKSTQHTYEFSDRLDHIFPYDYPVLFWMQTFIREIDNILDIGGNIGVHYFSYRQYLKYPRLFTWHVLEVPDIVRVALNGQRTTEPQLKFTINPATIQKIDVVYAAGSVQYIEPPGLVGILNKLASQPKHIIINKIPLYNGEEFVTLQNGGNCYSPYQVFNRTRFIESICALGYRLVDSWIVPERRFWLPCDPDRSFGPSSGLYFQLNPK